VTDSGTQATTKKDALPVLSQPQSALTRLSRCNLLVAILARRYPNSILQRARTECLLFAEILAIPLAL
jgi:hypothetical protein